MKLSELREMAREGKLDAPEPSPKQNGVPIVQYLIDEALSGTNPTTEPELFSGTASASAPVADPYIAVDLVDPSSSDKSVVILGECLPSEDVESLARKMAESMPSFRLELSKMPVFDLPSVGIHLPELVLPKVDFPPIGITPELKRAIDGGVASVTDFFRRKRETG